MTQMEGLNKKCPRLKVRIIFDIKKMIFPKIKFNNDIIEISSDNPLEGEEF